MRYKGYVGVCEVDDEAGIIHGHVVGLRDVITFQGKTVAEATKAFRESVDDYLDFCASERRDPDKPYNGNILVRIDPALHRELIATAESRKMSLNALVEQSLAKAVGANPPSTKTIATRKRKGV